MKLLIDARRVLALAFTEGEYLSPDVISPNHILAAQHRYIRPIIGESLLYDLERGQHIELLDQYVAPALAEHVRLMIDLSQYPVNKAQLKRAQTLLQRLTDYLNANEAKYKGYSAHQNPMNRCSTRGGVIIPR